MTIAMLDLDITCDDKLVDAFYLRNREVRAISPITVRGSELSSELVVAPGDYTVFGETYSMRQEGLYRFFHPRQGNIQRIVFQHDRHALLSAICWLVSHGCRDNGKSFEEVRQLATTGKIVLTCGPYSHFTVWLLNECGIPARIVQAATLCDRNGYNDGHVLTEVVLQERWIVFDPDAGRLYTRHDERLNLVQLVQHVQAGEYDTEWLTKATGVAIGHFSANGIDYDLWYETCLASPEIAAQAFRRPMMIPIIPHEGTNYFTVFSAEQRRRAEELHSDRSLHYLTPDEFEAHFYSMEN